MRTRYAFPVAAATALLLALPATAAAGPPTGSGCTFERGVSTCVSTTDVAGTLGPITGGGSVNDGSPQAGICALVGAPGLEYYYVSQLVLAVATPTTTTTRHRGAPGSNGKVLSSSAVASGPPVVTGYVDDYEFIVCSNIPV